MKQAVMLCVLAIFSILEGSVFAWNEEVTHKDLSRVASENSSLHKTKGDYLKNIGLSKGLDSEKIAWSGKKLSIREWFAEGAKLEDAGSKLDALRGKARFNNHFNNPLKTWEQAGLSDVQTGESALVWAQDGRAQLSIVEGVWTWQMSRSNYYQALTSSIDAVRQENFARTFRGLGHQMHLLQDMAVPEHVRNDAHPLDSVLGKNPKNGIRYFETWAKERFRNLNALMVFASTRIFPNVSFNVSRDGLSPVTQLFDADGYDGFNASAGINQGLAEYTSANFFSGDTIFAKERYSTDHRHFSPFPRKESTDMQEFLAETKPLVIQIAEDYITDKGIWIQKTGDGESINHFVRAGKWSRSLYRRYGEDARFYSSFYRDDICYEDYASKLIPRAVGYSASLLNYFFRGTIAISLPPSAMYAFSGDRYAGFSKLTLLAQNTTGDNELMDNGSIELVVRYRTLQEDPFQPLDLQASNDYSYKVVTEANGRRDIPRDAPAELRFGDGTTMIIPMHAVDISFQVVYHGWLGNEEKAVAVGFREISDPTPVELMNNMDKVCLNGSWYDAGSETAIQQVGTNSNGDPRWDIYLHDLKDAYVKISTATNPINASPSQYTYSVSSISAGLISRAYILSDATDEINHSYYTTVLKTTGSDYFTHANDTFSGLRQGDALKSQITLSDDAAVCNAYGLSKPCTIRHAPPFYRFRGNYMWGATGVIFDNPEYPAGNKCSWELLP